MSKLKSAVLYEYLTKVRAIGIFYLIQYLIVALIFTIVAICTKGNETGSNTLEFSSVVFVSVIGVLPFCFPYVWLLLLQGAAATT